MFNVCKMRALQDEVRQHSAYEITKSGLIDMPTAEELLSTIDLMCFNEQCDNSSIWY